MPQMSYCFLCLFQETNGEVGVSEELTLQMADHVFARETAHVRL